MAANPKIRSDLLKKLGGVTPQALSGRVKRLKKVLPISSEDAVYVIAHQNGIDIGRHLDGDTLSRVSEYVAQLRPSSRQGQAQATPRSQSRGSRSIKQVSLNITGFKIGALPGMSAAHAKEAKTMSEKAYPLLYVFENSARDLIARVLSSAFGASWWDQVVPKRIRDKAADRLAQEGTEPWHSSRGAHPIHYVDLQDLASIVRAQKAWPHFSQIFPRQNWFDAVIDDLNVSRRVVAHMNPLSSDDIKQIEAGFARWSKQLQAKRAVIP